MATVLPFPAEVTIEQRSEARAAAAPAWAKRGPTIAALLSDGPFPRRQAALAIRDVCHAVEALHGRGVAHGALNADTVVVTPGARARLLDPATWGRRPGDADPDNRSVSPSEIRRDVRDLGRLLRTLIGAAGDAAPRGRLEAIADRATGAAGGRPYRSAASLGRALSLYLIGRRLRVVR